MARTRFAWFLVAVATIATGCSGGDNCADDQKVQAWDDGDGDGYGSGDALKVCEVKSSQADNGDDCDDSNPKVHPDAPEECNGLDDDCNTVIDNGLTNVVFYKDEDGDTYGNDGDVAVMCAAPVGSSYVSTGGDCDDSDGDRNPGAKEVCDGGDNDCDGLTDDEDDSLDQKSLLHWYRDRDLDGYGRDGETFDACVGPVGSVGNADDCDDANPDVNPGADEVCDHGVDDDCDGLRDDQDDTLDTSGQQQYFVDSDQDGFGEPGSSVMACEPVKEFSASKNDGDCDDSDATVNPRARETLCDLIDNDCDEKTPDDQDFDLDGILACEGDTGRCDRNPDAFPGAVEIPADGVDQDCDQMELCYQDVDGDGARTEVAVAVPDLKCDQKGEARTNAPIDCDDSDATITISGKWETDLDGDGFGDGVVALEGTCVDPGPPFVLAGGDVDCNDDDSDISPAALDDACNDGLDKDCNGFDSCSTCQEWLTTDPSLVSGIFAIRPQGTLSDHEVQGYCDMTTDGGGWTLVGSSTAPMNDANVGFYADLASLVPLTDNGGMFAGLDTINIANSDMRFACKTDPLSEDMTVDLSFYDTDWYLRMLGGGDSKVCFNEASPAVPYATPVRRDNLTGELKDETDAYNTGALVGEDTCNDLDDFTVDFDDAGMAGNGSDGTDWGEADGKPKCGATNAGAAWYLFVRELPPPPPALRN